LKRILKDHTIDCVISDNRYGLWGKSLYTVFITHQLSIKCPAALKFFEPVLYRISSFFINKYDECWIPDAEGENNLSGELSHHISLPENGKFIGLLSRFDSPVENELEKKYDLLAIVSGPEPHRSLLLQNLLDQFKNINLSSLIVSGEPQEKQDSMINENIRLVSHLSTKAMREAMLQSEVVICRAGYSSIMDLVALKRKSILIPTPGQTEQEYLGDYLIKKKVFFSVAQKEFHIQAALKEINHFGDSSKISTEKKYEVAIKGLINKINKVVR
jgi:UDP-N-acetylglucosamine transferase subunit ALG13